MASDIIPTMRAAPKVLVKKIGAVRIEFHRVYAISLNFARALAAINGPYFIAVHLLYSLPSRWPFTSFSVQYALIRESVSSSDKRRK